MIINNQFCIQVGDKYYPVKNILTPASRFSRAKYLKRAPKDGYTIEHEKSTSGILLFYAWENKIIIPEVCTGDYYIIK